MLKRLLGLTEKEKDEKVYIWYGYRSVDNKRIHRDLGLDLEVWEHPLATNIYRNIERKYLSKDSLDKLEILYKNGYAFISVYGLNPNNGKEGNYVFFSIKASFQDPVWDHIYFLMDSETYRTIEIEYVSLLEKVVQEHLKKVAEEEEKRLKPLRDFEGQFRDKIKTLV